MFFILQILTDQPKVKVEVRVMVPYRKSMLPCL